jgi:metal-responsive CopG/Arc/MetJ family transcriptional regulator
MAKTARIEFRTDEVFIKSLEDLAKRTNRSRAEVIRDAMNLYIRAVDEWDKGRGVTFAPMAKVQLNAKTEANTDVNAKAPEPCPA